MGSARSSTFRACSHLTAPGLTRAVEDDGTGLRMAEVGAYFRQQQKNVESEAERRTRNDKITIGGGADNKRRAWQKVFTIYTSPIVYDVRDLNVTTYSELGFVHSVNHRSGTLVRVLSQDQNHARNPRVHRGRKDTRDTLLYSKESN